MRNVSMKRLVTKTINSLQDVTSGLRNAIVNMQSICAYVLYLQYELSCFVSRLSGV